MSLRKQTDTKIPKFSVNMHEIVILISMDYYDQYVKGQLLSFSNKMFRIQFVRLMIQKNIIWEFFTCREHESWIFIFRII